MSFKVIQSLFLILNSRYFWVDSIPYVHYFLEGCTSNNCSLRYQRVSIKKKKYHVNKQCSIMIFDINTKSESKSGITAKNQSSPYGKRRLNSRKTRLFTNFYPCFAYGKSDVFCAFSHR